MDEERKDGQFGWGNRTEEKQERPTYTYGPAGENRFVFTDATKAEYREEVLPPKRKRNKKREKQILAGVLALLLTFGAGFGGGLLAVHVTGGSSAGNGQNITIDPSDDTSVGEAIAAKVLPSVVGISTTQEVSGWSFYGWTTQELPEGVGTGFVVSEDGYILTNSHVVSDGSAKSITVSFSDGTETAGTVLWNDSTLDLAVVKVDKRGLQAAELGDSDEVKIGAYAAAIGNPLGLDYARSMSQGGISGLNRTITVTDSSTGTQTKMEGLIQTDAAINSGNSGGPLLNNSGEVIGINSARAASGEGMGFAIPINTAKPILEEVMDTGSYNKAYIGIGGADVSTYLQYYSNANLGTKTGAYVTQIYTDSPAAKYGLKEGDVIIAVDGEEVETMTELSRMMYKYNAGDKVTLTVIRDKAKKKIEITLATSKE